MEKNLGKIHEFCKKKLKKCGKNWENLGKLEKCLKIRENYGEKIRENVEKLGKCWKIKINYGKKLGRFFNMIVKYEITERALGSRFRQVLTKDKDS